MDEKWDKKTSGDDSSLPSRARHIDALQEAIYTKKDTFSSNEVRLMKKTKHGMGDQSPFYFFKYHDPSSRLAELEAYNAAICELMATLDYVSTARPYYDDMDQLIGVASEEILGFQPNVDDPLKINDTHINSKVLNREENQRIIKYVAQKLLHYYEIDDAPSFTEPTIHNVQCSLLELLNVSSPFPDTLLPTVAKVLRLRIKELTYNDISELQLLSQGVEAIETLLDLEHTIDETPFTIKSLEALGKKAQNDTEQPFDGFFDEYPNNLPSQNITNYNLLKGLGVSLTTRYLFKEKDNSNSNMSKKGQMIDFDWTKANISFDFHTPNRLNEMFRNAKENSFPCDEATLEYFPDIGNANVFYWPTKQPEVHKVLFNYVSEFLMRCEHELEKDEEIYKKIAQLILFINSTNNLSTSKSFIELTCDYAYQSLIYIKAYITNRPVEILLAEQTIKFTFAQLNQDFINWSTEVNKEIACIDKKEVNAWLQKALSTIDNKINLLTRVYNDIKSAISSHSQFHIASAETEDLYIFYGAIDTLFEELKVRFDTFRSEFENELERINRNTFSLEDNAVYKSLAFNPVFIFYKYKTCLKYVLTNVEMYHALAALNIGSKPCFDENGKSYNLGKRLVNDEAERIKEVRNTLLSMSDFKHFLIEHGQFALELIQKEFKIAHDKYALKKEKAIPYAQLAQALHSEEIERAFNALCYDCGIGEEDEIDYDLRVC